MTGSASFRFRLFTGLAIVIVAVPSLLVLQPLAVHSESFTLRVESIEVSSGGDAEVPISVKGASGIGAMQFVLSYDSSLLTVTEVVRGSLLGGDALLEFNADQPGRLAIAIVALEHIQGDGPIALARFSVEGEKGTSSPLELSQARAWEGESRVEALVNVEAGVLTIVGGIGLLLIILIAVVAAVALLISLALWRRGRRPKGAVSTG